MARPVPRTLVMGDPQGPFDKLLEVLERHGALAGDRLAPDVVLVSIGDHFDFDLHDPVGAGLEGLRILRWLASHDPAQVTLLAGNHDLARVMELAALDDEAFAAARALARSIDETARRDGPAAARARELAEFRAAYPTLPSSGVIGRDYASFSTAQRALVRELLLAGRFHLACTGALADGREVLLTHAGITTRELALLPDPTAPAPVAIAAALEAFLRTALDQVRDAWQRGAAAALSLEPLHIAGGAGEEGGGLLYHRPTNPQRPLSSTSSAADRAWASNAARPRRFDPRTLPAGITQVVGHTGHAKCVFELGAWVAPAALARAHGGIRSLRVTSNEVRYDLGIATPAPGTTDMIFIDGELRRVPAADVALLPLARLAAP